MKILIILLIIINFVFGAKDLISSQNQEAINLIQQVFSVTTSAPCDSGYIGCKNLTSSEDSLYYVDSIFFYQVQSSIINIQSDFSAFSNLTLLHIGSSYRVNSNFFTNLNKLNYLTSIFIDTHETPISDSITVPNSVKTIRFGNYGAKLVSGFFNSKAQFLTVVNPLPGYSIESSLNMDNYNMIDLEIPLTLTSGFPSNLNRLKSLQSLYIYAYNEKGTDINPSSSSSLSTSFPSFGEFASLKELFIDFTYDNEDNIQYFTFPSSINNIKSLSSLNIFKKGFTIDKSIGFIDVSNNRNGLYIDIEEAGDLLSSCTGRPCLVVPQYSGLLTFALDYKISNMDLSNFTSLDITSNLLTQELPNETIDFTLMESLEIVESNFVGKIPDSYCQLPLSSILLKFNKLTEVPSCFICIGYAAADNILPNKFTNFDESTSISCPNFYVNPSYNKLADAQGDIIYLEGKDMGYSVSIEPSLDYKFNTSNTKLGIIIPQGSGTGPFEYKITFANNPSQVFDFSFGYKKPTPVSFSIISSKLVITGTSFSSDNDKNSVNINSQVYSSTFTSPNSLVLDSNPVSGSTFDVIVTVDDQESDKITFMVLSKAIYINNPSERLNLTGGEVELSGSFIVSDVKSVSVSINSIPCNVKSVSSSLIKITYPSVKAGGNYLYEMIIGGNYYNSTVLYKNVEYPIPPVDESGSTSDDSSSSDDHISSGFKLNYNYFFILLSLSYILILI